MISGPPGGPGGPPAELQAGSERDLGRRGALWDHLAGAGDLLVRAIEETTPELALDNRAHPLTRTGEQEERLARMALCGAWYSIAYRATVGFGFTPLFDAVASASHPLTLDELLAIPARFVSDR